MSESSLSARLKALMAQADKSAADVARESKVSMATLSRILNGDTENPSFTNMSRIAEVLGVSLDTLAGTSAPIAVPSITTGTDTEVTPLASHIAATFVIENTDKSVKEAAQLLESAAAGVWVSCWTEDYVDPTTRRPYATTARQVGTKRIEVDLLFPHEMVEAGSLVGMLSVIAAAVTSTGARMLDMRVPEALQRTFQGPAFGVRGLRDMTNKYGRPLLSCTLRPMMGLSPKVYGRAIFEALKGGADMTCDPTLLHSIPGLEWRERFRFAAEAVLAAGQDTSEFKMHAANVSAPTVEAMLERADWAKELELGAVMVDSAAIGWTALQSLTQWCRENDIILCAMGGRALGGNMMAEALEAKLLRLVGCDMASIGSPLRGSIAQRRFSVGTVKAMRDHHLAPTPEEGLLYEQPFTGMEGCMPAVGGGHNPWHFPRLIDALGDDTLIQCGGAVMGHPWGSAAGATAVRVAVESLVQARNEGHMLNVDGRAILQKAMKYSPELKHALEFWQEGAFLFGVVPGNGKQAPLEGKVEETNVTRPTFRTVSKDDEGDK